MRAPQGDKEGAVAPRSIAGTRRRSTPVRTDSPRSCSPTPRSRGRPGLTEEEAKAKGHSELKVGKFPFAAPAGASVNDTTLVKVVADARRRCARTHRGNGAASDLISEAQSSSIEMGAVV